MITKVNSIKYRKYEHKTNQKFLITNQNLLL